MTDPSTTDEVTAAIAAAVAATAGRPVDATSAAARRAGHVIAAIRAERPNAGAAEQDG